MKSRVVFVVILSCLGLCGCSGSAESEAIPNGAGDSQAVEEGPTKGPHDAVLEDIASSYQDWGRVDDQVRWAPFLCAMPRPSVGRMSRKGPHGRKLYWLFAKNRDQYMAASAERSQPVGQVVVKEAWKPEETDRKTGYLVNLESPSANIIGGAYSPFAKHDGKVFKATEPKGLYVMYKVAPDTAGTDKGWIYGTLDVGGNVTAAGRLPSCMKCHEETGKDRLFGLQPESEHLPLTWQREDEHK